MPYKESMKKYTYFCLNSHVLSKISNKSLKWYTHTHTHTHTQLVFAEPIFSADEVIHLSENPT